MSLRSSLWDTAIGAPQIFSSALEIQNADAAPRHESEQRLGVIGSLTMDFAAKAIACAVFREGFYPRVYTGLFGSYIQESLDPASGLHAFNPDAVVIAPDWRDIVVAMPIDGNQSDVLTAMEARIETFAQIWQTFAKRNITVYQHIVTPPSDRYRGVADRLSPSDPNRQVELFTEIALNRAPASVRWIEIDRIARAVGLGNWAPNRFYTNGRLPFDTRYLPQYMRAFGGAWRAANFRAKKALIVDLDNTLWGGVIGDDGVAGIRLGPDTPAGDAFLQWNNYSSDLARRGVILGICSKNSPEIAKTGFSHPHAVLSLDHFGAIECSWDDKATMMRRIARTLNIGLDTMVFTDDNPAECELVKTALPEVGVVYLGADPSAFTTLLEAEHWFDLPRYTADDFSRNQSYAGRQKAEELRASATDLESFLAGLSMTGAFDRASGSDLARVAQLEKKTNQFNLTTRRYDDAAVEALAQRHDVDILVFSLRDRFASHGLVSSMITVRERDDLRIDSWLMSCRVFSRTAEFFIFRRLLRMAKDAGIKRIVGEFQSTDRNGVVAGLYKTLRFSQDGDNPALWYFNVEDAADSGIPDTMIADEALATTPEAVAAARNG